MPTQLQRNGDFSQTFGSNGKLITIYNPFTTRLGPDGKTYVWDPFQNNMVPMNLWSKVGVKVLGYYPYRQATAPR